MHIGEKNQVSQSVNISVCRKRPTLLAAFLLVSVMLAGSVFCGVASADLMSGKYGVAQVFDVQRSPAYPVAQSPFTVSGMQVPYNDSLVHYAIGTGYIQFFYTGNPSYPVGIKRYASDGTLIQTVSPEGAVWGLGTAGFLYVSRTGNIGTFVANSAGYSIGASLTYTPVTGQALLTDIQSYNATPEVLAAGVSSNPTPVPVMAGLWLVPGILAGGGLLYRRRKE